jgi:protein involved in temperature-dependent protein secretion
LSNANETPTPAASKPAGQMTAERALEWIDDVLEELGHALDACAETGADEYLVSAKINGFVMSLMARQPDLAARAAAAGVGTGGGEAA